MERLGIADDVGPDWENTLRRHASRQRVDVRCPLGHLVARYGLVPDRFGASVELLKGREPRPRRHADNVWLTISRVRWECPRCGFRRETTRQALQEAVEDAVLTGRATIVLGYDL